MLRLLEGKNATHGHDVSAVLTGTVPSKARKRVVNANKRYLSGGPRRLGLIAQT